VLAAAPKLQLLQYLVPAVQYMQYNTHGGGGGVWVEGGMMVVVWHAQLSGSTT
jgi:hypothetical protein